MNIVWRIGCSQGWQAWPTGLGLGDRVWEVPHTTHSGHLDTVGADIRSAQRTGWDAIEFEARSRSNRCGFDHAIRATQWQQLRHPQVCGVEQFPVLIFRSFTSARTDEHVEVGSCNALIVG